MLTPQEIMLLRSIKKLAVIILLMHKIPRPLSAKEISDYLDLDYETTRRYLRELSLLSITAKTSAGHILAQGGQQLVLPLQADSYNPHTPSQSAEIPRSVTATTATTTIGRYKESEAAVVAESAESAFKNLPKRGKTAFCNLSSEQRESLDAFSDYGISSTESVVSIVLLEHVNADYIHAQANRLTKEKRFSTPMLIHVVRSGDPLPISDDQRRLRSFKKYSITS